jgi:hypothetical protein
MCYPHIDNILSPNTYILTYFGVFTRKIAENFGAFINNH